MINMTFHYDPSNKLETPTFVLAQRSGQKIGLLTNIKDVTFKNSCQDAPEMVLKVYKYNGMVLTPHWDDINMFKLIYVPEADTYFSIECETSEGSDGIYKALSLTRLAESELGQIKVYGLQINTEAAIILPSYDANFPVVLYRDLTDLQRYDEIWNSDEKYTVIDPTTQQIDVQATTALRTQILRDSSLMHKLMSFAPHYSIGTVDETVRDIQRIFEFNGQSIIECLNSIADEESLIIDFNCGVSSNRVVNVYDALSNCNDCGFRASFTHVCPRCQSTDINEGFGANTGILVNAEQLGNNLTIKRNSESIANCYHVSGGDELMTDVIHMCNPNGGYIWAFSEEMKAEMSDSLHTALDTYEATYSYYLEECSFDLSDLPLEEYNAIIEKYQELDPDVKTEPITEIVGYSKLIEAYYNAIDLGEYLNHSLMPSPTNSGLTAAEVVAGLTEETLSPVSVLSTESLSLAQASSAVVGLAKIISDPLFNISVVSQDLMFVDDTYTWVGTLSATNYYDKADTAKTETLRIVINNNLADYAESTVMQTLLNKSKGGSAIVAMYSMSDVQLEEALKYYSYQMLQSINECFVKCVQILTSIGADDSESDAHEVYLTTVEKSLIVADELAVRESEVMLVDFKNSETCMTTLLWSMITEVIATMKIENNLTAAQWVELNSFRRESDFSNDNYVSTSFRRKFSYTDSKFISDSLSNAELIKRAYEFILQAEYKILENNAYSYTISTELKNLLAIDEFKVLRNSFQVGNWIRIADSSGTLYKLRLIDYEIDFDDLDSLSVNFADISLDSLTSNRMRKLMMDTQQLVDKFGFTTHQQASDLVGTGSDLTGDYGYSDSFVEGSGDQTVEILGDKVVTKFNIIDGLIQGKISSDEAMSLIRQELLKITLKVQNGDKTSSMTISYNGIDISTSGNITLGGTVIFTDDLVDGETTISGDNILTGEIKSVNYEFRDGEIFSDEGSLFSLINGTIRTKALFSDGETGDLYVQGSVYATSGRIGDFDLTEISTDSSYAVGHAHSSWKLRSAPIAGQNGKRYYISLTKNRNLVVSNSLTEGHYASNDTSTQCNIGMRKYPWRYGYFNRLYMDGCLLGVEYFKVTLDKDSWDSTDHTITATITGITPDSTNDNKIKQYIQIAPSFNDGQSDVSDNALAYYDAGIVCVGKYENTLVFKYTGNAPSDDIDVYVYAQYARPVQPLDDPFNCAVLWDADNGVCNVSWSDPNDEMFVMWDSTVLVRKFGSDPTSPTDGDVLVTYGTDTGTGGTSEKNKYSDNPYVDEEVGTLTPGRYYYRIFAIGTDTKVSSYGDSINTSNIPVISEVTPSSCTFEISPSHYKKIKLVYRSDSAPESATDGTLLAIMSNITVEEKRQEVMSYSGLVGGDLYFVIFAETDDGDLVSEPFLYISQSVYDFDYTGSIQTFTAPATGIYRIETWGAQGGSVDGAEGGYGGYSVVEVELQKDEVLYINVGGQDGYNGGGQ